MSNYFIFDQRKNQAVIYLKVKAVAKTDKIEKFMLINKKYYLLLSIRAIPEHGKANDAIVKFLANKWSMNKDNILIKTGLTNNYKSIIVKNVSIDALNSILTPYIF